MTPRGFLSGLWRGLDGLRKALHLIVLLAILAGVIGLLRIGAPHIPGRAALLIAPEGELVEQLAGDPLERAVQQARGVQHQQTLLWDLTDSIRAAATDRRIPVIVLDLDKFDGATLPTLEELAQALREFRATGKKVIAWGSEFDKERYYLAAQADESYLDPAGFVLLEGYGHYGTYLKDALDKLGVAINVFRVGAYKSAVESFTRTDMSPADRAESGVYLGRLWGAYQDEVTRARGLPAGALQEYADSLATRVAAAGGDAAKVALQAGLVTGIKSRLEMERRVIDLVGRDESNGSFRGVTVDDYVRYAQAQKKQRARGKARIGVIVASGDIWGGDQPPGSIGGDSLSRLIRQARLDKDVKALVLRVDSPGGSTLASDEIYRELVAFRASGKPLVVSMSGYAASGGYYISAPADEIWASPATLTGSIGIFAIIPTFDRTLGKIGVNTDGIGTTALSGQLRLDRPMDDEARTLMQSLISFGYREFLTSVAAGRGKTPEQIDAIGQGRVWAGADAQRLGLVDHLGHFDDALRAAARRARLSAWAPEFLEPELTWPEQVALALKSRLAGLMLRLSPQPAALARLAARFDPLTREVELFSRFATPHRLYAYCFCQVR